MGKLIIFCVKVCVCVFDIINKVVVCNCFNDTRIMWWSLNDNTNNAKRVVWLVVANKLY